jgi:hypothetical protein
MAATPLTVTLSTRTDGAVVRTPVDGALVAGDSANGNSFVNTGREFVAVQTDANARTITFQDVNGNSLGAKTLNSSKFYLFGPFDVNKYGATVVFTVSNAAVTAAAITLNNKHTLQPAPANAAG